jgi:predicted metal-dependent enzyme (double-stranded beta helix superfamily)
MSMAMPSSQLTWLADTLPTSDFPEVTEKILSNFFMQLDDFRADLQRLGEHEFERILPLSRETPTHYKWHLLTAPGRAFTVWLHEYKPLATRASGYAQTIHNHRYPMSALVLAGGYYCTKYNVAENPGHDRADVQATKGWQLASGSVYSMRETDFHSVTQIQDGTVSLLVQGQASQRFSVSVDPKSHRTSCHLPIEGRLDHLRSSLTTPYGRSLHAES